MENVEIVKGRALCKIYRTMKNVIAIDFIWRSHAHAYIAINVDDANCIRDIDIVNYGGFVFNENESDEIKESRRIIEHCLNELLHYAFRENKAERYNFFDTIYSALSYKWKGGEIWSKKTFRGGRYRPYFYSIPSLKAIG